MAGDARLESAEDHPAARGCPRTPAPRTQAPSTWHESRGQRRRHRPPGLRMHLSPFSCSLGPSPKLPTLALPTSKAETAVALPPGVSVSTELASAHQAPHQALRPAPGHPKSQHVLTARATTVYILWGSGRGLEGEVCPKASTPSPDTGLPSQPLPGHRKGTLRTQCQPKNKRPRWEATSLYPPSKQNCSSGKH